MEDDGDINSATYGQSLGRILLDGFYDQMDGYISGGGMIQELDSTRISQAFYNSRREVELHDFFPHGDIIFEDGYKHCIRNINSRVCIRSIKLLPKEDTTPDPLLVLMPAGLENNTPAVDTTGVLDASTVTNPAGIDFDARSEYYDTESKTDTSTLMS